MAQRMGRPTGRSGAYNRRNTRDMAYIGGTAATKAGTGVQTGKKSSGQTEKDRAASKSAAAP